MSMNYRTEILLTMKYMTLIAVLFRFNCLLVLNEKKNNALASSEKLRTEIEQCHGLKEFSENFVNANAKTPIWENV